MPPGHSPLGGILTSHHKSTKIQLHCRSRVTCRFPDKPAMNSLFSRATNLTSKIMLDMFTHVGVTLLASRQGPSGPHVARCSNIGRGGNPNLQTWANVLDLKANSGNSKCRCFFFIQHNEQNERLTNIHWDIKFENISNKKQ